MPRTNAATRAILGFAALTVATLASSPLRAAPTKVRVISWNDLGMHCMDPGYQVFALLPPLANRTAVPDALGNICRNLVLVFGYLRRLKQGVVDTQGEHVALPGGLCADIDARQVIALQTSDLQSGNTFGIQFLLL